MRFRNPCNTTPVMRVKLFFAVLVLVWAATAAFAKEDAAGWTPPPRTEMPTEFDWVQLPSGEWLGGEIIVLYEDSLEFDSDEMGITKIDWEDVVELRSVQILKVRSTEGESATGKVLVKDGKVQVIGDETVVFEQSEIITITAGVPREINFWSGEAKPTQSIDTDFLCEAFRQVLLNFF